ncbi:MAG TPA: hypothetical protein VKA67_10805 [Verrucomicrobiae bacterium]|nr:hypothetical protein [Verrucomicrobiae bacterium]
MRIKFATSTRLATLAAVVVFAVTATAISRAADLKLEAQLIWGTNDANSPNSRYRPVEPEVARKLKALPFKWSHYYVVNRVQFTVPENGERKERMSKVCEIQVKNLGDSQVQLTLYGKGEPVGKITQALPKGELLVTGGNAANSTAWFVALRQVK